MSYGCTHTVPGPKRHSGSAENRFEVHISSFHWDRPRSGGRAKETLHMHLEYTGRHFCRRKNRTAARRPAVTKTISHTARHRRGRQAAIARIGETKKQRSKCHKVFLSSGIGRTSGGRAIKSIAHNLKYTSRHCRSRKQLDVAANSGWLCTRHRCQAAAGREDDSA